jgi:cytochrome c
MNSFELNKVLGAILGTCLILLALHIGAGAIFSVPKPAKPGYVIAVKTSGGTEKKEAPKKEVPIALLLEHADPAKGKDVAKQCQVCHTLEKGGPNRVGPNLWNIVESPRGEDRGGFNFSAAMKKKGGKWTYEELNKFLSGPQAYIPGTAMTFIGLPRDNQRADVIAYLRTLSDNPPPLPKPPPQAAQAAAPAAPAPAAKPAAPKEASVGELLAHASVDKGKDTAKQCQICHTLDKGGPNRIGPNLWNIVGGPRGEDRGGFAFSDAMKKKGGNWSYDELFQFLKNPQTYIPGTKMTFAGIDNDQRRADVIAYLRTLSDKPEPLPAPAPSANAAPPAKSAETPKAPAAPAK